MTGRSPSKVHWRSLKVSPLSYFIMRQSGFHGFQWFLIWPKSGCSWQCWLRWRGRDAVDEVWKILWVYPPWKVKMNFWDPKTKSANKWRPFGLPNHNADRQDSALVGMVFKKIRTIYTYNLWDIHAIVLQLTYCMCFMRYPLCYQLCIMAPTTRATQGNPRIRGRCACEVSIQQSIESAGPITPGVWRCSKLMASGIPK